MYAIKNDVGYRCSQTKTNVSDPMIPRFQTKLQITGRSFVAQMTPRDKQMT